MIRSILLGFVIMFTTVMSGCATKVEQVVVEKSVYRPIPSGLLATVESAVPPTLQEMQAMASSDERVTRVLNFGALQTFNLGVCNLRIDKIRGWDQQQQQVGAQ